MKTKNSNKIGVYSYKFEGQYLDLQTLVSTQQDFLCIIKEIQMQLYPDKSMTIQIESTQKGSFELYLIFDLFKEALPLLPHIIDVASFDNLKSIFNVVEDFVKLRKFLKGESPTKVVQKNNKTAVYAENGNVTVNNYSYNLYSKNIKLNNSFEEQFKNLKLNEKIKGIEITDVDGNKSIINNNDFDDFIEENQVLIIEEKYEEVETTLTITKTGLDKGHTWKWGFLYQGMKINAKILSKEFHNKLEAGVKFGMGDCLHVKLKILKEFDEELNAFKNKRYEIIEVFKIIHRGEQTGLNL